MDTLEIHKTGGVVDITNCVISNDAANGEEKNSL